MSIPDTLEDKLEMFRRTGRIVKYREGVFLDASWVAVYFGQRVIPEGFDPRTASIPLDDLVRSTQELRERIRREALAMPDHVGHIQRYCPMKSAA
jgi:tryptophan halogenase